MKARLYGPGMWGVLPILSGFGWLLGGCGGFTPDFSESEGSEVVEEETLPPGDDDTGALGNDDSPAGGDDDSPASGDDDSPASEDDDSPGGDDDATVGDDDTSVGVEDEPTVDPADVYSLQGVLGYEFVPYDPVSDGLDYAATEVRPIRGAVVKLLDAGSEEVIWETTSDNEGQYSFLDAGVRDVKIWVYARTVSPPIRVEDNTSDDAVYVLESETVDLAGTETLNVTAGSGWGGQEYTEPRASGPFSVLDAAYSAGNRLLTETTNPPDFEECLLNWSIDNRPIGGDKSRGNITTSHWDGSELYILGQENVDTDEFDIHVTVHEWSHYFESTISRSDSIGGPHSMGYLLDPRVAFGEGFGNAMSAIILDPDIIYSDSLGPRQQDGFTFDLEANSVDASQNPGWYSEGSIQALLFDLYDPANEDYDALALGIDPLYQVMIGGQKDTPSLTTVFSFLTFLKEAYPQHVEAIDTLVAYHSSGGDFGIDAVQDIWGTGETHGAELAGSLPICPQRGPGDGFTVTLQGGGNSNLLDQNRFFWIAGTGSTITVSLTSDYDLDLFTYRRGESVAVSDSQGGTETIVLNTLAGEIYVVNVRGYYETAVDYTGSITITE